MIMMIFLSQCHRHTKKKIKEFRDLPTGVEPMISRLLLQLCVYFYPLFFHFPTKIPEMAEIHGEICGDNGEIMQIEKPVKFVMLA